LIPAWNRRDSNRDADFPTTAQNAERNYALEGGNIPVQGVIAITPTFISHVLKITGPISIPEYAETVTAQNLVSRIHYHQLGPGREGEDVPAPDGHSSVRKHFTELLAEHFLARVRQLPASALPTFLQVVQNAMLSRDVQLYFNVPIAEDVLHLTHIDGAIATPSSDSLFVVDANVGGDKANAFITNTMSDQVTLDAAGNATHHTTLNYAWLAPGNVYGNPIYEDYLRIYVPPGSILHLQSGWEPQGTSGAFGREVWAGFFTLTQSQTRTITLVWTVPHAAQKNTQGWQYQYLVQHQAGTRWMLHLQVALPLCALVKNTGSEVIRGNDLVKKLDRVLSEDVSVEMSYKCTALSKSALASPRADF